MKFMNALIHNKKSKIRQDKMKRKNRLLIFINFELRKKIMMKSLQKKFIKNDVKQRKSQLLGNCLIISRKIVDCYIYTNISDYHILSGLTEFTGLKLMNIKKVNCIYKIIKKMDQKQSIEQQELTEDQILEQCRKGLQQITKADIVELKSLNNPPCAVKVVLEGLMILFGKNQEWSEIRKQVADPSFLQKLMHFDKEKQKILSNQLLIVSLMKLQNKDSFNYEYILKKNKAAAGLAQYCFSMNKFHHLIKSKKNQQTAEQLEKDKKETQNETPNENNENQKEIEKTVSQKKEELEQKIKQQRVEIEELQKQIEILKNKNDLDRISKNDITNLMSYNYPPEIIFELIHAIVIILNKYPEMYYTNWKLLRTNLLSDLKHYPKEQELSEEIGDKLIGHRKQYPDVYDSQKIANASKAGGGLAKWAILISDRYSKKKDLVQKEKELETLVVELENLPKE